MQTERKPFKETEPNHAEHSLARFDSIPISVMRLLNEKTSHVIMVVSVKMISDSGSVQPFLITLLPVHI